MQLGSMVQQENKYLTEILRARWGNRPLRTFPWFNGDYNECFNRRTGRAGFIG